ncbi:MAG: 4'-phosphopantetheinyl transferase family protein [Flavobacteriales bacterium]
MIGNDVIDLQLAAVQSNWQRPGFREKIFTERENRLIDDAEDPFRTVWRLWSMKESAYKAYLRLHPKRFFDPKKLLCSTAENGSGEVQVGGYSFRTQTTFDEDRLYTTAVVGKEPIWMGACFTIPYPEDASAYCHQRLRAHCADRWSVSEKQLCIEKTAQGVPRISCASAHISSAISISHHGRFGAYLIQR